MSDLSNFSFGEGIDIVDASSAQIAWVKLLAYGASGAGKTSLMATMPDRCLVLLTEGHGDMTIKRVNPNAKIVYIKNEIEIVNGKARVVKKASEKLEHIVSTLESKETPFTSVVLDSLTDMQQVYLDDSKGGVAGADISLKEWGRLLAKTKALIRRLRNLNMHVGVICLSDEIQDNNGKVLQRPSLAGKKLPGSVSQYFNLCCFQRKARESSSVVGASYESVFEAGDEYYTKTHPALLPIETPSVRGFIDKMANYASEHDEGDMPTQSAPNPALSVQAKENDSLQARLDDPKIKALFDKLKAPEAKRIMTLKKYTDDAKVITVLEKKIEEAK